MPNKINSIIQFVGGITIITNPSQPVTAKRNKNSPYPCSMWRHGSCTPETQKLIDETAKEYPFINDIRYV